MVIVVRRPTFQVVVDCKGAPLSGPLCIYLENLIGAIKGYEWLEPSFWITRTDLYYKYEAEHTQAQMIQATKKLSHDPRHEPSCDLYFNGGIVPVGRLINLELPPEER
jgi:hypothetical protein